MVEYISYPVIFGYFGLSLLMLICMVFFHEVGHLIAAKAQKVEMKGKFLNYSIIAEPFQSNRIIFMGILSGLFPLLIIQILQPYFMWWLMLIPYFVGCRHDIKEILS